MSLTPVVRSASTRQYLPNFFGLIHTFEAVLRFVKEERVFFCPKTVLTWEGFQKKIRTLRYTPVRGTSKHPKYPLD